MSARRRWTRQELLVALALYYRTPFSKTRKDNPEIIRIANAIGRTPSALAMKLGNFGSLDAEITGRGRSGLRNASAADREVWREMQDSWEHFAIESHQAMVEVGETEPFESTIADESGDSHFSEDRPVHTTARIGQSFFRSIVLEAYRRQCCISGLSVPELLVASHIVPWRYDKNNRVNPRNGLLLSALHDKAFDIGLFTIDDDLTVRVSRNQVEKDDKFFLVAIERYDGQRIRSPIKFKPERDFLAYHRRHIFRG